VEPFYIQYNIFCYPRIYSDLYLQTSNNKSVTGLELHTSDITCFWSYMLYIYTVYFQAMTTQVPAKLRLKIHRHHLVPHQCCWHST